MSEPPSDRETGDRFAADDRFVRALLRRCVADPHLVDDLAQETWLAALRQNRGPGHAARAWLGTVARNFVLQSLRGRVRRAAREQAAARQLAVDDVGSDAELRTRVLAAVEALAPAYREVVRLRFFDDRMPGEIADLLALPVETVRTRLKRALQRLQSSLRPGRY